MAWHDIWPKQRANATRRRRSPEDQAYGARVRANKTRAATKRSNERISAERTTVKREQRLRNKAVIAQNEATIADAISAEFRELKARRRKERDRRWSKRLQKAHDLSREAGDKAKRAWQLTLATPPWANRGAMLALHRRAKLLSEQTGTQHHVDHIVPILSPLVCGLHCEQNMCILPGPENTSKGNRHWPDMP
jgi:hypothetical protein